MISRVSLWCVASRHLRHSGGGRRRRQGSVQDLTSRTMWTRPRPGFFRPRTRHTFRQSRPYGRKAGGKDALEYLKITLDERNDQQLSGSVHCGDERLMESFSLNFRKITYEYNTQTEKGGKGSSNPVTYDVSANANRRTLEPKPTVPHRYHASGPPNH